MIDWKVFDEHNMPNRKGLYLVTIKSGSRRVTEAAYWNAYGQKKWTGYDISESGDMCEVYNVIAYAKMPEPYLTN